MSRTESQQAQQEYAQMQQNYQSVNIPQESLLKHNEEMKADIRKKIEDYLKEYNKAKGYNYIYPTRPILLYISGILPIILRMILSVA